MFDGRVENMIASCEYGFHERAETGHKRGLWLECVLLVLAGRGWRQNIAACDSQ